MANRDSTTEKNGKARYRGFTVVSCTFKQATSEMPKISRAAMVRSIMMKKLALTGIFLLLSACGTFTVGRTGKTLDAGQVDLSSGLAANTLPEVVPHVQGAVGVTNWMEIVGQYEVFSGFGEVRFQALKQDFAGVDLAIGVGGGYTTTLLESEARR